MAYRTRLIVAWSVGLGIPIALAVGALNSGGPSGILGLLSVIALLASIKVAHLLMRWLPNKD